MEHELLSVVRHPGALQNVFQLVHKYLGAGLVFDIPLLVLGTWHKRAQKLFEFQVIIFAQIFQK